jgi:DNA-binding MarR family transcriptional regulator
VSKELARGKVSFPQYLLLGFLTQSASLTMTEIAIKMAHTTAAATGMVDRLENLGYVLRARSGEDRRKIIVQITPSGTELVLKIRTDMVGNLMEMMKCLEPDEQKMWLQIYSKILIYCVKK